MMSNFGMRRCGYCHVYKGPKDYASDLILQCMVCTKRRRQARQAKKAKVSLTTDGRPARYCSDCGGHRPESDFGVGLEYRTCIGCRNYRRAERAGEPRPYARVPQPVEN